MSMHINLLFWFDKNNRAKAAWLMHTALPMFIHELYAQFALRQVERKGEGGTRKSKAHCWRHECGFRALFFQKFCAPESSILPKKKEKRNRETDKRGSSGVVALKKSQDTAPELIRHLYKNENFTRMAQEAARRWMG